MSQKPWRQLAFVLGEAALSLVSGGVLFIIISRTSGPELLGEYALSIAWLMLFQGGSSFGIPEFIMRETGAHGRDAAGQVVHAMVLGLGTGLAAICVMLVLVRTLGYRADLVQAISIASLALIPAFLNTVCRGAFMAQRQMQVPFMAALVENAIMTSASLYLLLSGHGAVSLMIALVGSKAASASIATVLAFRGMFPALPPLDLRVLMETARTVFSFGMGNLFGILSRRINTIMVSLWVSIEAGRRPLRGGDEGHGILPDRSRSVFAATTSANRTSNQAPKRLGSRFASGDETVGDPRQCRHASGSGCSPA